MALAVTRPGVSHQIDRCELRRKAPVGVLAPPVFSSREPRRRGPPARGAAPSAESPESGEVERGGVAMVR